MIILFNHFVKNSDGDDKMAVAIKTASFKGIQGTKVNVEVEISRGLPAFNIVGMANTEVKESKERVRSAIINSGYEFPMGRITVNLAPADMRKEGTHFDLPIAIGILSASLQINIKYINKFMYMGELSLSGCLLKVRGAVPIIIEGLDSSITNFIVPKGNAEECSFVQNANIYPCETLIDVINILEENNRKPYKFHKSKSMDAEYDIDFSEVYGQSASKRAIEVAAAGKHNIALEGPPGAGKTMLARRIPTILPKLSYEEALEVTKIYSVYGLNNINGMVWNRPFRSPHHTSSVMALTGGGLKLLPGEISLAHNGVLFLDELLEFKRDVLEVLRQPLEDRVIKVSRYGGCITYPANIMLVCAYNPCPCGFWGSSRHRCTCSPVQIKRYSSKLSGPLVDRIDIFSYVKDLDLNELENHANNESSEKIRERVVKARELQKRRFIGSNTRTNSEMNSKQIEKFCRLDKKCKKLMEVVFEKFNLSARTYNKVLKVARTIADLDERENIEESDIIEASQYRKTEDA